MADQSETAVTESGVEQRDASNTDAPSLASLEALTGTYKHAVGELRQLLYCKVCIRPMYEPYTVACGHTFCYGCLRQWFENHRNNKTCPECRTPVWKVPAPAYTLREIVQLFLNTREFLPPDDDIPDHEQARQDEATQVEKDKAEKQVFGNSFGRPRSISPHHRRHGIHDYQDGVRRCPNCFWELEHGYCNHCDAHIDIDYYDSDHDHGHPFPTSPSGRSIAVDMALHGVEDWSLHSSDSEDLSDDFGEMDDFIIDDIRRRHADSNDEDDLSDVDSLELARQRLNSTGSAYSVSSVRSPGAHNQSHPRLRRGTSEPTEGLLGRRHFDQTSSEESSSESETASIDTDNRRWPIRTQNHTAQRVNFAPNPTSPNSSDEAEEIAATAASQPRHARKRRRVVADDSDEDDLSPMPESSSTPAHGERDQSAERDQENDSQDASRSRGASPANSDEWEAEVSHHPECPMRPSNRRRPLRANRGAPPVALSRFSRRGRRQVADD